MGILDKDYAAMVEAPSAFRDVAEEKIANMQTALDTADLQHINDKNALDALQTKLGADEQTIITLTGNIDRLGAQLASALAPLGNFTILRDLQKWKDPVTGWQPPQVSAAIGAQGNLPVVFTRNWNDKGNLVLDTTGKTGEYSDWVTALHIPNMVKPTTRAAMVGWGFTVDANQKYVQCHEQDALFPTAAGFFNGSVQWNAVAGQIQIETGPDANGKGAWMNCGVPAPRLAAGRHTLEVLYFIDQVAHTIQYAMIIVDGVRNIIPATIGVRGAFAPKWTAGTFHLQAQEDANSQGGSFQTVYDSIWAIII